MKRHVSPIAKQRISDFFIQEDGNVGRKNALMAGTVLSSVMLAATLFAPQVATASHCLDGEYWCGGDNHDCCSVGQYCCSDWVWVGSEKSYYYFCEDGPCPPQNSG